VIWTFITNVKTLNDGMIRWRTRLFDKILGRERTSP
jgi:hypothetical protein